MSAEARGTGALNAQLTLGLALPRHATFETFVVGGNGTAVRALRALRPGGGVAQSYVWGGAATGKTHLFQALCRAQGDREGTAVYFPLERLATGSAEVLDGVERLDLVCLDDLDAVAGEPSWERAVFNLINRCRDAGCVLVFGARTGPAEIPVRLPDLASRLGWGPVFRLLPLADTRKMEVLRIHASQRGLRLPDAVARYLLTRCARDLHRLLDLLDELDDASLVSRRPITIPLVRSVLDGRAAKGQKPG